MCPPAAALDVARQTAATGFQGVYVDANAITPGRRQRSAPAFASYNKISYALAAQACALADGHGVLDDLLDLAAHLPPGTPLARPEHLVSAGPRAWRWGPEMREIAQAWRDTGLPGTFAEAAAGTFDRWHAHKDDPTVTVARLLSDLTGESPTPHP
ncbi:DUF1932 domain-containing protein [Streptomyces sp. NPDC048710]|uniref:DUF1932 domain-containing protein n=1 Tax=Streptomyces sp. NPDC048710 TaxID=3365586 RepID=UPI00372377F6